jgi:hypothetical protein
MFVAKAPINRDIFGEANPLSTISMLKIFMNKFILYAATGYTYHAASMQLRVIAPVSILTSLFFLYRIVSDAKHQSGSFFVRIKTILARTDREIKLLFIFEILILIFAGIAALHESCLLQAFIRKYIPILKGFNWGRVWIFNRVLWYIVFALCLYCILQLKGTSFHLKRKSKPVAIPSFLPKLTVSVVIGLQMTYIFLSPASIYNDMSKTWFNKLVVKTGLAEKISLHVSDDDFISYKEFFAEDLFNDIKQDISYTDEKVVAFGYHPSVLLYNGFNCIDGYLSFYPLEHMRKFRALIAPELEMNKEAREYFDGWGGRMYLYNSELSFQPTRNKSTSPVQLNIDMHVFSNDFNGKYILSRAEILNADELGLVFKKKYDRVESIYTIYLYAVDEKQPRIQD